MSSTTLRYPPPDDFSRALRKRVRAWLDERGGGRRATPEMVAKAVVSVAVAAGSYAGVLLLPAPGPVRLGLWSLLGLSMLLIAVNIAHDATHGAWSRRKWVNRALARSFDLVGINTWAWQYNHLRSHHVGPNVGNWDAAIDSNPVIRFHPEQPLTPLHRWQHLTFPLAYAAATLQKWFFLDFFTLARGRIGGLEVPRPKWTTQLDLVLWKVGVIGATLALPLLLAPEPAAATFAGFLAMHATAGIGLAIIFQVTHLHDRTEFVQPDEHGRLPYPHDLHVLRTTADFLPRSRIAGWFTGGLHLHVAHHLFPSVAHGHHRELTEVIREVAAEHGVEHRQFHCLGSALRSHTRLLRRLGRPDEVVSSAWAPAAPAAAATPCLLRPSGWSARR